MWIFSTVKMHVIEGTYMGIKIVIHAGTSMGMYNFSNCGYEVGD
jgi:hypothetical protein